MGGIMDGLTGPYFTVRRDSDVAQEHYQMPRQSDPQKITGEIIPAQTLPLHMVNDHPVVRARTAALYGLVEQVEQMRGLFPDEDGAIAAALADAYAALPQDEDG